MGIVSSVEQPRILLMAISFHEDITQPDGILVKMVIVILNAGHITLLTATITMSITSGTKIGLVKIGLKNYEVSTYKQKNILILN